MPITIKINDVQPGKWEGAYVKSPDEFLERISPRDFERSQRIISSQPNHETLAEQRISASTNGFVWSAIHAYNNHHHLILRPEDIWFAIITQLGFYLNANAEELQSNLVAHKGKKNLTVVGLGSLSGIEHVDLGGFAEQMAELIGKNVHDEQLVQWVMPEFSTTTSTDRSITAMLFMSAMQEYFSYTIHLMCGIPSVTLLGEVTDWIKMLGKLTKLESFGHEPKCFAEMLRPILYHLILTFEQPQSPKIKGFWNTIMKEDRGSGTAYLSGWITAFCYWSPTGEANAIENWNVLNGVSYPVVATSDIPVGFASVPVTISDDSNKWSCIILAGSIGVQTQAMHRSQCEAHLNETEWTGKGYYTALIPVNGWLIYKCQEE